MKHSRLGIFAVVATSLLALRLAPTAEAALSIAKGPYLQTVTSSSIVVMWQTDSASDSTVTYTPSGGSPSTVSSATAVTLHQLRLTGLAADTAYTYQVSSTGTAGSVTGLQGSFHTAPTGAAPFRFDVYGDSRTFPADHAKVVAGIVASAPRFVLHTGDICMDSTVESQWAPEFFTPAAPALRIAPYYPCLGNHEHESPLYFQYFSALPQGGGTSGVEWYSFDYANAHFAIVDTNVSFAPGSAQYNWLVSDLQHTTAEWRFVMHHHPAYSSGPDGPSPSVQSYLVPLYEQYHVDAVFNGHDHLYERSYKNGVTYIVSGGGGADLYTPGQHANPYQVFAKSIHQFVTVDINSTAATLTGRDANGVAFDSITLNHAPTAPVASFTGTPTSGAAPLTVSFHDASTGTPTSWSWTFGDGGTSTQQHPSHSYAAAGSYTVSLTASNAGGSNAATKTGYITVTAPPPPAPVAAFSATPTSGTAPLTVQFTDTSTGSPTSWNWSFGDGGTSTAKDPAHTYSAAGTYTVSLTASNAGGSNGLTKSNYITVAAPPAGVTAEFSASPTRGRMPLLVQFADLSTGSPTSWHWAFGDRTASAAQNPAHTYRWPGRYTVALTVAAGSVTSTATKTRYIRVGPKDVLGTWWAFDQIVTVWDVGLVQGYPDGTYRPTVQVTRDQMAAYLARAIAGSDTAVPAGPADPSFLDVSADHWAYRYLEYLSALGVTLGYPGGAYHPSEPVTREQLAAYLARAIAVPIGEAGLRTYPTPLDPSFPDVQPTSWAYKYVEYVKGQGVIQGYPDGTYHPQDVVTRDQMAVYIQRAFQLPL